MPCGWPGPAQRRCLCCDYSVESFTRAQDRYYALDSKAFQTVGLVAVVGGILAFGASATTGSGIFGTLFLGVTAVSFAFATVFCLLSLRVRALLEPPAISRVVRWVSEQDEVPSDTKLLAAMIIDLANAEGQYLSLCLSKARLLALGQAFDVVGIIALLVYVATSRLG